MIKSYALEKECSQSWKRLIIYEKERKMSCMEEGMWKLVRKLSKSNLFLLQPEDDSEPSTF